MVETLTAPMSYSLYVILIGIIIAYLSESFLRFNTMIQRLVSALGVILVIIGVFDLLAVIFGSGHLIQAFR